MCGGHLQNGKPVRRKNPGKMGKILENAEMAEKWPPKWKKKEKKWPKSYFRSHFSSPVAIFRPFQAGGHFPKSLPFSPIFCAGPVSHSVDGHRTRKDTSSFPLN